MLASVVVYSQTSVGIHNSASELLRFHYSVADSKPIFLQLML
jgi:hypothetical protein